MATHASISNMAAETKNLDVFEFKCCVCQEKILEVRAVGEQVFAPDTIRGRVVVTSRKKSALEAKNSVQRRLEYILQLFRKSKIKDKDVQVSKQLTRKEGSFSMQADVIFAVGEVRTYEEITNTILEKLGSHPVIGISEPDVFHSPGKLEAHRLSVCLEAIQNAKNKAQKVAAALKQKLGSPVSVVEEEASETTKSVGSPLQARDTPPHNLLPAKLDAAAVKIRSQVVVKFQLVG